MASSEAKALLLYCSLMGCSARHQGVEPLLATATAAEPAPPPASPFVRASGARLWLEGEPYAFLGVNLWYGAYLGAEGRIGDVGRLRAELDLLQRLGVTNLRVLGASEAGPMQHAIEPTFRGPGDDYNEELLRGLDLLLIEMAQRNMKAVVYLTNFWEWSGGMGTYLSWVNGGDFVDLSDPEKPWPAYPLFTMQFYESEAANRLYREYIRAVLTRINTISGKPYRDDPTIMAWQLANEPRPGVSAAPGSHVLPAFYRWIDETSAYIKALDPNHLVSTGNEGSVGCADHDPCFLEAHDSEHVDYLTFHIWPKNWNWLDEKDMSGSMDATLAKAGAYVDRHIAYARELGKALVLEEFGLPRDGGSLEPGSPTVHRDRFLGMMLERVLDSARDGQPLVGSNLWSWAGYGRAERPSAAWQEGDKNYTGDPPQEPQGLNSVFDVDTSTLTLLGSHAVALGAR